MSIEDLNRLESLLETHIGKAFLSERVVMRGKDLHHELGDRQWMDVFLYAITGRQFTESQLRFLNFMWVASSYPDPGIWPNQVAALGGSARSTASLSLLAGLAVSEAKIYGRRPERKILDFFHRAACAEDVGISIEDFILQELSERRIVAGYGRPLARVDERIPHTLKLIEELGLEKGRYFQLAFKVYEYLKRERNLSINIAALNTAIIADMGMSTEEYQQFLTVVFITGIAPCYQDARARPEGSFFAMRCENLNYRGHEYRRW